jgi:catechol 2,3-dioxygenase-like lactoylglutathione lyase family enzyme
LARRILVRVTSPIRLVEFPADDPARARWFWNGVLGVELEGRLDGEAMEVLVISLADGYPIERDRALAMGSEVGDGPR